MEERSIDRENILISMLVDLSVEARPSVSINNITISLVMSTGLFHIHIPFVQAYVVLPIENPLL